MTRPGEDAAHDRERRRLPERGLTEDRRPPEPAKRQVNGASGPFPPTGRLATSPVLTCGQPLPWPEPPGGRGSKRDCSSRRLTQAARSASMGPGGWWDLAPPDPSGPRRRGSCSSSSPAHGDRAHGQGRPDLVARRRLHERRQQLRRQPAWAARSEWQSHAGQRSLCCSEHRHVTDRRRQCADDRQEQRPHLHLGHLRQPPGGLHDPGLRLPE